MHNDDQTIDRRGQIWTVKVVPVEDQNRKPSSSGLYKTEVIRQKRPWKGLEDVEFETLDWAYWYNTQRLLEPIGHRL